MTDYHYSSDRTIDSTDNNEYSDDSRDENFWEENIIDADIPDDDIVDARIDSFEQGERPAYGEEGYRKS